MRYYRQENDERDELRRLVAERDKKLKPKQWRTIITDDEMRERKRLGLPCDEYQTLKDFKTRVLLTNPKFNLLQRTLSQQLADDKFRNEMREQENTHRCAK